MENKSSLFLKFIQFIFDKDNHGVEKKDTSLMREPNAFTDSIHDHYFKKIMRGQEDE